MNGMSLIKIVINPFRNKILSLLYEKATNITKKRANKENYCNE